jgi:hypothetical protein
MTAYWCQLKVKGFVQINQMLFNTQYMYNNKESQMLAGQTNCNIAATSNRPNNGCKRR